MINFLGRDVVFADLRGAVSFVSEYSRQGEGNNIMPGGEFMEAMLVAIHAVAMIMQAGHDNVRVTVCSRRRPYKQMGLNESQIGDFKLKGITEIEKLIGKGQTLKLGMTEAPDPKPALVKESDKRKPWKRTSAADYFSE